MSVGKLLFDFIFRLLGVIGDMWAWLTTSHVFFGVEFTPIYIVISSFGVVLLVGFFSLFKP